MTDHASELRKGRDDSTTESSSAHRPSEQEAADHTSIPAYLGGEPQREQASPNLSLASQQTSEANDSLSQEMQSMSLDGSANSETPTSSLSSEASDTTASESEAASETEAVSESETETEPETETEEDSESGGGEENAEAEAENEAGAGEADGEQTEEETEEETESQEEQESRAGEGEAGEGGDAVAQGQQRRTGGYAKKGRDEMVAIMPKLTPIRTPYVPSPPKAALVRRDEILERTGSPPEYHHALVRQGVQRTAQAARDAQRRMLFNIGNLGMNTRISIEEMAVEVQGVTAAAVKQINDAVDQSMRDIDRSSADEQAHITAQNIKTGEELQASRDRIMLDITADLMEGSEEIRQAAEIAEGRFNEKIPQAVGYINAIPGTGVAAQLPPPPNPQAAAGGNSQSTEQSGGGGEGGGAAEGGNQESSPSYKVMPEAEARLTHFMDLQSERICDFHSNVKTYLLSRASPVLTGMAQQEQARLVTNAGEHATRLSSDANKAQFITLVLSLTTPVSQHHAQDESQSVDQSSNEADQQLTETQAAVRSARRIINNKGNMAKAYADRDMRDTLTKNIRKSGNKAAQGLRSQASSAETALNNSAAQMAEAYRDLVRRLDALLPAEQFLDSRNILPKLIAARDSAFKLQQQHEKAAQQQASMTLEKMDKVKRDQMKSISKAGRDSANSMQDVVTRTSFDMSMFSSQMTGEMSAGAIQGIAAAQEYATRMAEGIIESKEKLGDEGLRQVDAIAVGFLNGAISAAAQGQYQTLENFVKELEKVGDKGSLTKPMMDSRGDLDRRASAIDNAMPGQSLATAGGLAILSPIAAGVYLYCNDGDEDVVIEKMGNLMWPGVLGLEDVFNEDYSSPSLLRPRIRSELGSPEKWHALNLLNTSALVRGLTRMSIANYSTGWFDYNRAARESTLQGLSAAERDAVAALNPQLIEITRTNLTDGLNEHQGAIASAYLDRNRERAVAARTRESLDKARGQGEWGWIFSAQSAQRRSDEARVEVMANMRGVLQQELAIESAYVPREAVDRSTQRVQGEFASLTDPERRAASAFSPEDAQAAMTRYATSSHISVVQGWGSARVEHVRMSDDASQYISDLVKHGPESNQARTSRGVFEFRRAEGDSTLGLFEDLSETSQTRLSDAFENPRLATLERQVREARNPRERSRYQRQLDEERGHHRARMQTMARRLGAPEETANDPAAAERWMASQVGDLFKREDDYFGNRPSHARYGQEMITGGRASLVAGVQLATEGAGTHEALLRRSYGDRSRAEIDAANAAWALENEGENMEEMLGVQRRSWDASDYALMGLSPLAWFATRAPETSGDLAFELERLSRGNRETDLDHVQYAGLHYNQERVRGAGFLARGSMRGTPEQQNLDGRQDRLAQVILNAARAEAERQGDPDAIADYERNPGAIFSPDGSIDPVIEALAFSADGSFSGDRQLLQHYTQSVSLAAESFRNEIDRQEKMLTTGITVLALVASVALMLIPGVNVVAAGIITAVIAGAATIAVKAGMRGERYGWEEAATDVATTAIEAATAGFGGALGGGLGKSGALAGIGAALKDSLGAIGSAVVREAFVSAISSGAQVALQDEVWQDGLDRGLERVLSGAVKGAAVAAVTAGISEGLTSKLNTSMSPGDIDPTDFSRMQKLGRALGPNGSEIFRESVSELLGSAAGETVGVINDYATGKFEGKFGDALKRIGQAGLRDMVSGAMRAGATSLNKARYRGLLDAARSGEPMSPSDQRALRLAAISAGAMNYDDGPDKVRAEIDAGRELLGRLPQNLREQASSYDLDTLRNMVQMINSGDIGSHADRTAFLRDLSESVPDLDGRTLMREMEAAIASLRPADEADVPDPAQQARIRQQLGAGMDPDLRMVMDDVRIEGLEHLAEADLRRASEMIARGEFDSGTADALFRQARLENPDLSEFAFLRSLADATATSHQAQAIKQMQTQKRYSDVMDALPLAGQRIFADLPDESIKHIKQLLDQESVGPAHLQDEIFRQAQQRNPELTRDQFDAMLNFAVIKVKAEHAFAKQTARQDRQQRQMSNVPEHLRGTLSVLPDAALVDLHLRQMDGSLSPDDRVRLEQAALRENPDLDLGTFRQALDEAVQHGTPIRPGAREAENMRREMLSAIPDDQRAQLANVPILVMRPGDFEAFTRSASGNAVTLIMHGEPVIVIREGANPRVLREEGIHALQSKDPKWAERLGALSESHLQRWDDLPLEQQMALYRNKIDIELDAHDRMIDGLAEQLRRSNDPAEQAQLRSQLEMAQATISNLQRRQAEVASIGPMQRLQIEAGLLARPQWLDQPARLFGKGDDNDFKVTESKKTKDVEIESEETTRQRLSDLLSKDASTESQRRYQSKANKLPIDSVRKILDSTGDSPEFARRVINIAASLDEPSAFSQNLKNALNDLPADQQDAVRQACLNQSNENAVKVISELSSIRSTLSDPELYSQFTQTLRHSGDDLLNMVDHLNRISQALSLPELKQLSSAVGTPEMLAGLLSKFRSGDDSPLVAKQLTEVLNSFEGAQRQEFQERMRDLPNSEFIRTLSGLEQLKSFTPNSETFRTFFDLVTSVPNGTKRMLEPLVDIAKNISPEGRRALADILTTKDKSSRNDFVEAIIQYQRFLTDSELKLFGKQTHQLLDTLLKTAATQKRWLVHLEQFHNFVDTLRTLPDTPANRENIEKILKYLTDPDRDPADIADDINASAKILGDTADRSASINEQVKRLEGPDGCLAGKDTWRVHLDEAALRWDEMTSSSNPKIKGFADLVESVTPGWSAGERGSLKNMQAWFEHLAKTRGIDPTDTNARKALLEDVFARGFSKIKSPDLQSKGKYDDLARAFREMAVEAELGISGKKLSTEEMINKIKLTPDKYKAALDRIGLTEEQLAARPDRDNIIEHLSTLTKREIYYSTMRDIATGDAMKDIASEIGALVSSAGIKQNITEVIGEIALSRHILETFSDFRLAMPFGKGTGFDQVWVQHNTSHEIPKYIIGEAKGPGAGLGSPKKGEQMSAEWVYATIREMMVRGNAEQQAMAKQMMLALMKARETGQPILEGLVIEAGPPPDFTPIDKTTPATGQGGYNFKSIPIEDE